MQEYARVDEKLQSFQGRGTSRQLMSNKPSNYGLNIFALCYNLFRQTAT